MRGRLAVSDSLQGILAVLTLPDLEVGKQIRLPFRPGRLCHGAQIYCADLSEAAIYAIHPDTLAIQGSYSAAPEIEALAVSKNNMLLYVLAGGADSLQMIETGQGRLLNVAHTGIYPRGIAQSPGGNRLAVACGGACEIAMYDTKSLRVCSTYQAGGIACGVCFFGGQIMALCATGEYDIGTVVGAIGVDGKWNPWTALPGLPGAMTPCGGGLLVGHLRHLTMLDPPNGRIRWQTKIAGLPSEIISVGRAACFIDSIDGLVGLVDLRRGAILRRLRVGEPSGITVLNLEA